MIRVENLEKSFGSVRAVDGVSFTVDPGEIFGLLGPNGAGKTTTISVLATLLRADAGRVTVCGHDPAVDPAAVRRRIGVVPQEIALYEELNARDNLVFWGRLHGMSGKALSRRVDELLEAAELAEHSRRAVRTYSGGMKRRLNIMAGLVHGPEVLFLDEPTVGIDAQARSRILDMVREMNRSDLTVLYTTHYLEEAEQLCDRIGVIDTGRLVAIGDKDELISQIGDVDQIRFRLPDGLESALREEAPTWPGVESVAARRGKMEIRAVEGAPLLPLLTEFLGRNGAELHGLEVIRPNLESLYLKVTGRALRE